LGFGTTQGDVKPADANLQRIAKGSEPYHANGLPKGEPHLGKTLRETVSAHDRANAAGFVRSEIGKSSLHGVK